MLSELLVAAATDVVAILLLAWAIYYRRHRRTDLLLAYIALNLGVFAVTVALSTVMTSAQTGIGLGLGLFGVLSIIRLRSDQITQGEIAYYFVSLVLGLIAGLHPGMWVTLAVAAALVMVMFLVDHPRVTGSMRRQVITLDAAYLDEAELRLALGDLLRGRVDRVVVLEVDLVRDVTVVDVRYRAGKAPRSRAELRRPHYEALA